MSVKNKKRHRLRLTTHADVASFNAAAKHISKADRMQKNGGLKHKISNDLFDVEVEPERSHTVNTRSASHAAREEVVHGCSKR